MNVEIHRLMIVVCYAPMNGNNEIIIYVYDFGAEKLCSILNECNHDMMDEWK